MSIKKPNQNILSLLVVVMLMFAMVFLARQITHIPEATLTTGTISETLERTFDGNGIEACYKACTFIR